MIKSDLLYCGCTNRKVALVVRFTVFIAERRTASLIFTPRILSLIPTQPYPQSIPISTHLSASLSAYGRFMLTINDHHTHTVHKWPPHTYCTHQTKSILLLYYLNSPNPSWIHSKSYTNTLNNYIHPTRRKSLTAFSASSIVSATMTPLPAVSPFAFTTNAGYLAARICSQAWSLSLNAFQRAVGMLYFAINSLANALLVSILAASFVGPKQGIPSAVRKSTRPSAKGASGPTTTKSILFFEHRCFTEAWSVRLSEVTFSILPLQLLFSMLVPPFPGATYTFSRCWDSANLQAKQCSLPPPPITRTWSDMLWKDSQSKKVRLESQITRKTRHKQSVWQTQQYTWVK